jgi:O6-methylguanine-DNA--protein-cysteine methyltransferase
MEHYKFIGIIKHIYDTQTFKNNFKKREIVLISDEEYPQEIKFEFTHDEGIQALDNYLEGEEVTIAFLLKGNEFQGKYYTNLRGIAIGQTDTKQSKTEKKTKTKTPVFNSSPIEDNLPF